MLKQSKFERLLRRFVTGAAICEAIRVLITRAHDTMRPPTYEHSHTMRTYVLYTHIHDTYVWGLVQVVWRVWRGREWQKADFVIS